MQQASRAKVTRRAVHGVLLLDKPLGLSSNQALQKVKWFLRAEKAGHTGTLDPLATGVLPICFGAATKFSQVHLDADKAYEAVIRLGVTTTTGDAEGDVLEVRQPVCTPPDVDRVLASFLGMQMQVPPMSSALKRDGVPLYELARKGISVERPAREITIHSLRLLALNLERDSFTITIHVMCSKGTYIRTLGEDIGKALGCGGHLIALRRMQTGAFDIEHCITLDALEKLSDMDRVAQLLVPERLLTGYQKVVLEAQDVLRFQNGLSRQGNWMDAEKVAVVHAVSGALLGTARVAQGVLYPTRLLNAGEVEQCVHQAADYSAITAIQNLL